MIAGQVGETDNGTDQSLIVQPVARRTRQGIVRRAGGLIRYTSAEADPGNDKRNQR